VNRVKCLLKRFSVTAAMAAAVCLLGLGIAGLLVYQFAGPVPAAAQVIVSPPTPWTAIGASGTVDESSIPLFGFSNASALYGANASLARLEFRYNVVNVMHRVSSTGGIPTITQPGWTTLEFGAQAPATSTADAYLYRVTRCNGQQALICWVRHTNTPAPGACRPCQFPNTTFDFGNYLYYVRVILGRSTQGETPAVHTIRIL
jgi:hypothetical protein